MKLYHGTTSSPEEFNEIKTPLFLYQDSSFSETFSLCYSSNGSNNYNYEFLIDIRNSKIFDLNKEKYQKIMQELLLKHNITIDNKSGLIKDSYKTVGREVYNNDVDLALYPQIAQEILNLGFSVIKSDSPFENLLATSYVVLDSKIASINKIFELTTNDQFDTESILIKDLSTSKKLKI